MRIFASALLMLLCWWPAYAAAADNDVVYRMEVTGTIETDSDGRVSRYTLDKGHPPAVEKALVRDIVQWRFEPILVDGQPASGKTAMWLELEARAMTEEEYLMRIARVSFGAPVREANEMMEPPIYPFPAVRAGLQARVVVVLQLDGAGHVMQAHAEQVSLDHDSRHEAVAERWRRLFKQSSLQAAMKWTFNINEFAAGEPVGMTVRIPVDYQLTDRGHTDASVWQRYIAGPRVPAPWLPERDTVLAQQQNVDSLNDGDVQALSSLFRPIEPIIGRIL